jgi:nicotinamidase/pyrazinamidase
MKTKLELLIIDPQFDFCDPEGALYVPCAERDMEKLAKMILKGRDEITDIRVTMDSHRYLHIAHPIWWIDEEGKNPQPFTMIELNDLEGDKALWRAANPDFQKRSVDYVQRLKSNGKYNLMIWPPHCLIGSNGHQVYETLFDSLIEWEKGFAAVDFVTKGVNMFTEHYSAVKADVEDPDDNSTHLNTGFIEKLKNADKILISGEALSHCVASTVKDIVDELGEDQIKKFVLLEDASSPVAGFEDLALDFVKEMRDRGMETAKTTDFF